MREEVVFCLPSTPIDAIAKLLADNELPEIVVLLDQFPVGYVATHDILDRLIAGDVLIAGSDFAFRPSKTEVVASDVMRRPALQVDETRRVSEVVALMAQHGRQLALVLHENATPVGMFTARDLADFRLEVMRVDPTAHD